MSFADAARIARKPPRRSSGIGSTRARCGRDVELLELGLQQTDLMLADRSQPAGRQTLLFVKGEHRRCSVV